MELEYSSVPLAELHEATEPSAVISRQRIQHWVVPTSPAVPDALFAVCRSGDAVAVRLFPYIITAHIPDALAYVAMLGMVLINQVNQRYGNITKVHMVYGEQLESAKLPSGADAVRLWAGFAFLKDRDS